jgi:hypothetical protein
MPQSLESQKKGGISHSESLNLTNSHSDYVNMNMLLEFKLDQ